MFDANESFVERDALRVQGMKFWRRRRGVSGNIDVMCFIAISSREMRGKDIPYASQTNMLMCDLSLRAHILFLAKLTFW